MQRIIDSIASLNLRKLVLWAPDGATTLQAFFISPVGIPTTPVSLSLTTTPSSLLGLYRNAISNGSAELPGMCIGIRPTTNVNVNWSAVGTTVGSVIATLTIPPGTYRIGGGNRVEEPVWEELTGQLDLQGADYRIPGLSRWCMTGKGGTASLIAEVYDTAGVVIDRTTFSVPASAAFSFERLYQIKGSSMPLTAVGARLYSTANGIYYNTAGNGNPLINNGVTSAYAPASGSLWIDVGQMAVIGRAPLIGGSSLNSDSNSEFSLGNFIADQSRTVTAHAFGPNGLLGIQTWTVTATAQNLSSLSGFTDVDAQCWYIGSISGGRVMWLPCSTGTQTVDASGNPGYRLRVGDIIGEPLNNGHELESLFLVFTETALIKQSSSTTLNTGTGNRLSTAGGTPSNTPAIVDSQNYKLREIHLIVNAVVANSAITGAAVLEIYQALDTNGSGFETTPFYSEELPVIQNQTMRHVLPLVPGIYKVDILNESGANLTGIHFSTKAITR